ncbi:RNase P modulator RnpM [Pseudalkalibacillus berkeleyi]|uniref:YlxR family protein n=1 Tax=Pseudalkalibacillus berkeleyi TaxID=1069813 RepID=A0ABS9GWG6_9BACL|nr:YlxR family protein [Pseudalkalibacillus berkeleyi]MCF6137147.1 YlxR family protein [Pseudalkalibacillus berkeleyi]
MKKRKIPMRKCIACQENKPKKELIRVVRTPDGEVSIDLTGKKSGRGAYICDQISCFELAQKKKALQNQLSTQISETVYETLQSQVKGKSE